MVAQDILPLATFAKEIRSVNFYVQYKVTLECKKPITKSQKSLVAKEIRSLVMKAMDILQEKNIIRIKSHTECKKATKYFLLWLLRKLESRSNGYHLILIVITNLIHTSLGDHQNSLISTAHWNRTRNR